MEKKNNCMRVEFSTILWAVLAILLYAAPCGALTSFQTVPSDGTLDLGTAYDPNVGVDDGWVDVYGTLNMYSGAYVDWGIYTYNGSTVNIHAGEIGEGYFIMVVDGSTVTVYGTAFAVDGGEPLDPIPDQVTFTDGSGTLTVTYDDDTTADLLFYSDIPINLVNTAGGEPLEAQLWVFPWLINRYGPLPKIWAMVRMPEDITKDKIDSTQALVLYANGYDDVEIEASCQRIVQWCRNGIVRTTIFASFDKASLTDAIPDDGQVGLKVVGQLNTGQEFYGIDTVRIVSLSW